MNSSTRRQASSDASACSSKRRSKKLCGAPAYEPFASVALKENALCRGFALFGRASEQREPLRAFCRAFDTSSVARANDALTVAS
jgi:hypothetical protein